MIGRGGKIGGAILALCSAIALSGCGDDDDDDSDAAQSGAQASGQPIVLGYVNTENSPAGDYSGSRLGSEAAVEYINEELGGISGRPLELDSCITNGSPETSIGCANTFVQGGKVAVLSGVDLGAPGAIPIYNRANMPVLPALPVSAEEYTSPVSFSFTGGGPSAIAGLASYIATGLKASKVSVLAVDVPAARAAYEAYFTPVLANLGVTDVNYVYESATTADLTPALTLASQGDPDAIVLGFGGPACGAALRAAAALSVSPEKLLLVQECASKEAIATGNGGGDGAYYQSPYLSPDSDDPNAVLYRDKMQEYAPDAPISVPTQGGFNLVMNFYEVLKTIPSESIGPESVLQAFRSATNVKGFVSHSFTCDGQQLQGFASICDTNIRMLRYENGEFVDAVGDWVNGVKDINP